MGWGTLALVHWNSDSGYSHTLPLASVATSLSQLLSQCPHFPQLSSSLESGFVSVKAHSSAFMALQFIPNIFPLTLIGHLTVWAVWSKRQNSALRCALHGLQQNLHTWYQTRMFSKEFDHTAYATRTQLWLWQKMCTSRVSGGGI